MEFCCLEVTGTISTFQRARRYMSKPLPLTKEGSIFRCGALVRASNIWLRTRQTPVKTSSQVKSHTIYLSPLTFPTKFSPTQCLTTIQSWKSSMQQWLRRFSRTLTDSPWMPSKMMPAWVVFSIPRPHQQIPPRVTRSFPRWNRQSIPFLERSFTRRKSLTNSMTMSDWITRGTQSCLTETWQTGLLRRCDRRE